MASIFNLLGPFSSEQLASTEPFTSPERSGLSNATLENACSQNNPDWTSKQHLAPTASEIQDLPQTTQLLEISPTQYFLGFEEKDTKGQFELYQDMWYYVNRCKVKYPQGMKRWVKEFENDMVGKVSFVREKSDGFQEVGESGGRIQT